MKVYLHLSNDHPRDLPWPASASSMSWANMTMQLHRHDHYKWCTAPFNLITFSWSRKLTLDEVMRLTHLRQPEAAEACGFKPTAFKKRCRELGIAKWPFRQVSSNIRAVERMEGVHQELQSCPQVGTCAEGCPGSDHLVYLLWNLAASLPQTPSTLRTSGSFWISAESCKSLSASAFQGQANPEACLRAMILLSFEQPLQ